MQRLTMLAIPGTNARPGTPLKQNYITVHNTANTSNGADADNHARYVQGGGASNYVSYHVCVDDTKAVWIIPENEIGWHAGDGANGPGNTQSLAIEICENSDGDLLKATDNAVIIVAEWCKKYNIPIERVVQHNHWSGKDCPRRLRRSEPYSWEAFLEKVKQRITSEIPPAPEKEESGKNPPKWKVQVGAFSVKNNANAYMQDVKDAGFDAFITVDNNLYKVQVGAFSEKSNADNYAAEVQAFGFDAYVFED